jgi:hypothetical protein
VRNVEAEGVASTTAEKVIARFGVPQSHSLGQREIA